MRKQCANWVDSVIKLHYCGLIYQHCGSVFVNTLVLRLVLVYVIVQNV
jgi:hypothetical protein